MILSDLFVCRWTRTTQSSDSPLVGVHWCGSRLLV